MLLLKTICGLIIAVFEFWCKIVKAFKSKDCIRSKADPCICYCWTVYVMLILLSWIDKFLCVGHPESVEKSREKINRMFKCDDVGNMEEYVGCKIGCLCLCL